MLRPERLIRRAAAATVGVWISVACSSDTGEADSSSETGAGSGAPAAGSVGQGTGGMRSSTGGTPTTADAPSGGISGAGGVAASGNVSPTTGGAGEPPPTGGAPPATGGASAPPTGGTNTGGLPNTGGEPSAGGDLGTGGGTGCDGGPLATSLPDCQVEPLPSTGDYHQDCVNEINQFRWQCQCLPPLERWVEAEECANEMAQYDYENNSAHGGFIARICDPGGSGQCECPGWGSVESITHGTNRMESCLAMMWHEVDYPDGEQGHYEAMSSTRYTTVACGIYEGPDGEVWAVQNYSR